MATRKIIDAKHNGKKVWLKSHAQATFMSDGTTVEDAINQIGTDNGGITVETDPIFSASPAAWITNDNISSWNDKVDKVDGKQLSTEDFTTILKQKLEDLSDYDDTVLFNAISTLRGDFDKLVSGDTTTAIKTFNEVIAFLDGIQDTQDLSGIIASIELQIADKMDKITLATVAMSGSYNDLSNKPTIPDVSNKQDTLVSGTNIKTINGNSLLGSGDIVISGGDGNSFANVQAVEISDLVEDIVEISGVLYKKTIYVENDSEPNIDLLNENTIYIINLPVVGITIASFNNTHPIAEYIILFSTLDSAYLTLPSDVIWANGLSPKIEANSFYELSINTVLINNNYIYKAILVPFK